jgi:nucleoside-diphosphate-sugar epimerase
VRQVIGYLHDEFGLPLPHFGVPFTIAYPFAWLMEKLDAFVPWEPLVTRSIIHLMEETAADNDKAERLLGYRPRHHWREAVSAQMAEMRVREIHPMKMFRPVD